MEVNHIEHLTLPFHHLKPLFSSFCKISFHFIQLGTQGPFLERKIYFQIRNEKFSETFEDNPLLYPFLGYIVYYRITYSHGVQEREASKVSLFACIFSLLWFTFAFFDDLVKGCSQNLQL